MCSAIVLSREVSDYRALAKKYYRLTDEQLAGVDIHHNPPRSEGGRNIVEHLYVYSPDLHAAIHGGYMSYARRGYAARVRNGTVNKKGVRTGGGMPKKTEPTDRDKEVYNLRRDGLNRQDIMKKMGLKEYQVKRSLREMTRFGFPAIKGRGRGGYETQKQPKTEEVKRKIREARAKQAPPTPESLRKRSESMKKTIASKKK